MNVIEIFRCGECGEDWHSYARAVECCRENDELEEDEE